MPSVSYKEEDVYELLLGQFKSIFADLVILTGTKPSEILFELEAVLSHLAVSKRHPDSAQENVNMAMKHLQRATLDAAKMLYITYVNRISDSLPDKAELRKYILNCPDSEFLRLVTKAEKLGLTARKSELENMGRSPSESIQPYYDAATAMGEAYFKIDPEKMRALIPINARYFVERHWIGFLLGIGSSSIVAVAGWILSSFFSKGAP